MKTTISRGRLAGAVDCELLNKTMMYTLEGSVTDSMEAKLGDITAEQLLQWADHEFEESLAVTTSFGIQSAVTLHLVTQVRPEIPVIWVDTGYLPEETLQYAYTLTKLLKLNLHIYESAMSPEEMENQFGRLWESDDVEDLNRYDRIRKVEPLQRALKDLGVAGWISGLRTEQTEFRKRLPRLKRSSNRYRIYPILHWTSRDVYRYMEAHGLPQHPLFHEGYVTVGDKHSSRPMTELDANERDTRFKGLKQECGLHL